jgi:hypothetical protein
MSNLESRIGDAILHFVDSAPVILHSPADQVRVALQEGLKNSTFPEVLTAGVLSKVGFSYQKSAPVVER